MAIGMPTPDALEDPNTGPRTLETTAGTTYSWRHKVVLRKQDLDRYEEMISWCRARMGERGHPAWDSYHISFNDKGIKNTIFYLNDTEHYAEFALTWL